MLSIGFLFSELAHASEKSFLERLWPVFAALVVAAAAFAVYSEWRRMRRARQREEDE
jgi:flagellar biosynthesis/type III secretory pathway M-ring protein FliF/YscJ